MVASTEPSQSLISVKGQECLYEPSQSGVCWILNDMKTGERFESIRLLTKICPHWLVLRRLEDMEVIPRPRWFKPILTDISFQYCQFFPCKWPRLFIRPLHCLDERGRSYRL